MKKRLTFLFAILIIACVITSCAAEKKSNGDALILNQPAETGSYSFESYDELASALCSKESDSHKQIVSDSAEHDYGQQFTSFLSCFAEKNEKLMAPCINGEPMQIGSSHEWQKIVLLTNELYHLPWIWYYCEYQGETVVVCVSYPDVLENARVSDFESFREYLPHIAPDAPIDASALKDHPAYQSITEENITLYPNIQVSAVRYVFSDNGRVHYRFLLNKCLVSVWAYNREYELTKEFFGAFSLEQID